MSELLLAGRRTEPQIPKCQADATLDQDNPVSGTKYTILDTTKNVRIVGIAVKCTWTVQPTPLEIHVTIDGQTWKWSQADPVSNTWYNPYISASVAELSQIFDVGDVRQPYRAFLLEGRNVKVEAEITGGTVSNLSGRIKWAKIGD